MLYKILLEWSTQGG